MVNIGFIGAGEVAGVHATLLRADARVRLTGVYDPIPERAAAFAARYESAALGSVVEVLAGCQAVFICSPNTTHVEMALAALAARRHVFCEKPFAIRLADAQRLRDAARQAGVVYQVGHNRRFAPVYDFLHDAIRNGRLVPEAVHARMNRGELLRPSWVWDSRLTGGFLFETPVHMFDLLRYLFGEIAWVRAAAHAREHDELDDFSLLLGFASGLHATMTTYAHATWHFPFERMEVFGRHATYETFEMERISYTTALDAPTTTLDFTQLSRSQRWGYQREDQLFLDAVLGEGPPAVTAEDGFRVVEIIDACYRSVARGERVDLQVAENAAVTI